MKNAFLLWLFIPLAAFGSHTMAWKVPLRQSPWDDLDHLACQRLDAPPADSAFFRPGDELWDVTDALNWTTEDRQDPDPFAPADRKVPESSRAEWLIWNASTERLIGRGSWAQLDFVERSIGFDDLHKLVRVSFGIIDDQTKSREVSILTRLGETSSFKTPHIDLECEVTNHDRRQGVEVSLLASWTRGEGWRDGIDLAAIVPNEEPVTAARWEDGEGAWKARVSCSVVTVDGTSVTRLRRLETSDGLVWPDEKNDSEREEIPLSERKREGGLAARTFPVSRDLLGRIRSDSGSDFPDLKHGDASLFPGRGWIDVIEPLRANGVNLSAPGAAAGFHPDRSVLTVIGEPVDLDLAEQILAPPTPRALVTAFSLNTPSSTAMILCSSGEKSRIFRSRNDKSRERFAIAGNVDADGQRIDASYVIAPNADESLVSATTLVSGAPQEIGSSEQNGRSRKTTLTGTVRPITP